MSSSALWNVVEVVALVVALVGLNLWQLRRAMVRPSALEEMERLRREQETRMQARMDRQAERIEFLEAEMEKLWEERQEEREEMDALVETWKRYARLWEDYARQVARLFRELTGQEPPKEPSVPEVKPKKPVNRPAKAGLAARIARQFSIEEMNALAYEMGIETEEFGGETREVRARELVDLAWRRGISIALVRAVNEARPE